MLKKKKRMDLAFTWRLHGIIMAVYIIIKIIFINVEDILFIWYFPFVWEIPYKKNIILPLFPYFKKINMDVDNNCNNSSKDIDSTNYITKLSDYLKSNTKYDHLFVINVPQATLFCNICQKIIKRDIFMNKITYKMIYKHIGYCSKKHNYIDGANNNNNDGSNNNNNDGANNNNLTTDHIFNNNDGADNNNLTTAISYSTLSIDSADNDNNIIDNACDTCGGICSWEHIPPALLRESILKSLISFMSHNKTMFNDANHKKQIVFELADLFKIFMQHQPTHALFKAILAHNLHTSKTLRGLLSLNQLFDLLTKHVPAEFKIPVSFMLDGVAVLNIESALDDLAEKKPEVKQTLKEYRELVCKAKGVRTTEIDTLIKALLKIKLLFWYDDYAKNNVDNRNTIMQMVLALYPDRDNDTSMAEFYAYKHFYSLSTGYSKNDKGFNSAMKNILKQFKELEEIIEVVPMMDGIAFYKFFGISSTKSHVTKYRGKWTNLQKNPEFLPCNSRHNERMKDVISKLGTPTFDINNTNHNQLCKCGCYDFEVDDLKWKQAPLSDHTVPIAAWETVGTASLTSEFFMDKISTMLNTVEAKNNKGRFEQFGRDSGISGTNIDRLYKMLEISDALKKAQEEGLDTYEKFTISPSYVFNDNFSGLVEYSKYDENGPTAIDINDLFAVELIYTF